MDTVRHLVMLGMAASERQNRVNRAAGFLALGVQVPEHPDQGHHGQDQEGMAALNGGPLPNCGRARATGIFEFCQLPFLAIHQRQNVLAA